MLHFCMHDSFRSDRRRGVATSKFESCASANASAAGLLKEGLGDRDAAQGMSHCKMLAGAWPA